MPLAERRRRRRRAAGRASLRDLATSDVVRRARQESRRPPRIPCGGVMVGYVAKSAPLTTTLPGPTGSAVTLALATPATLTTRPASDQGCAQHPPQASAIQGRSHYPAPFRRSSTGRKNNKTRPMWLGPGSPGSPQAQRPIPPADLSLPTPIVSDGCCEHLITLRGAEGNRSFDLGQISEEIPRRVRRGVSVDPQCVNDW